MNNSIIKNIGNTSLIKSKNNIHYKLEGQNPSGSIKDRAAIYMIRQAKKRGDLNKKIILEASSGNMGISLAMLGAVLGYKVKIIMSEAMSIERRKLIEIYGAEIVLTNKNKGTMGAIQKAKELTERYPKKYWFADQFNNPDNVMSHYHGIAKELIAETTNIDYIIGGLGTSGTLMGIAKRFKEFSSQTKIIGITPPSGYVIQGIQNQSQDFSGKLYSENYLDEAIKISFQEAVRSVKSTAKNEGLFVGLSSGAAIYAANQIAQRHSNKKIIAILPDKGEKYMSLNFF